jgi:hypothetical protein
MTWRRRLAIRISLVSPALLPRGQRSWGSVMRTEVEHIADDKEALHWALSNTRACAHELVRTFPLRRLTSARTISLLWIVLFIMSSAQNVAILLASRLGYMRAASALGWSLRDFQYERFVALARAIPQGVVLLMGAVVVAFIASLYLSLRRSVGAFATFCAALGSSLCIWLYELGVPAYLEAISKHHRWRIGACFVMSAAIVSALRYSHISSTSSRVEWHSP